MLRRLLNRVTEKLPVRDIRVQGRKYLERYYVGTILGQQIYIHRFLASDPDEEVHDHPWPALSVILAGYYLEELIEPDGSFKLHKRRAGRVARIGENRFHRIHFPQGATDTWTLFIHGKRIKGWGFWNKQTLSYRPFALNAEDKAHGVWWENAITGKQLREQEAYERSYLQTSEPA